MNYIRFFKDISFNDANRFGGKAASLGELTQAGIPVPSGFAIDAQAYRDYASGSLGQEFETELYDAFRLLGADRVAVRSSALAEDAGDASWAGQLESYLNTTRTELMENIHLCWGSMDSEHARAYAADKNISEDQRSVAVVVQSMIASEKSGVMFTVNPITADTDSMIIESIYGLGEMIVQGITTPDRYEMTKQPLAVVNFDIAIKNEQMLYIEGKNQTLAVPDALADKSTLREEAVLELARIGLAIERHYGKPQDIEWAYADNTFYVLQSRPITTL